MRTNIEIDNNLIADAMKLYGIKTKKEAVDKALELFVRMKKQSKIRELVGKVKWEGSLRKMRGK
jgi:Arc/MetJ family transcription regulator